MIDLFIGNVWSVMLELAPWLLLGAAVSGLVHVFLPDDFVKRHLTGRGSIAKAVALGVPLPLCSCGVIPAGLGLKKDGASDAASVGFLISTPQTGVDSVLVSAAFLGWPFAVFKVLAAGVTGMVGGWLTEQLGGPRQPWDGGDTHADATEGGGRLSAGIAHAEDLIQSIWGWLAFGVLASAAITTFLPAEGLTGWSAWGAIGTMVAVLLVSLPLYVCATASVPIAASLVAGGMPTGAALVFLMAGPASNIATMGAIKRAFGARILAIYLVTIVAGSVGLGMLFDALFSTTISAAHHHGDHATWWATGSAWLLVALLVRYALADLRRTLNARRMASSAEAQVVLRVEGMTCGGCVSRLERTLQGAEGITLASVSLEPGQATVQGSLSASEVAQIIDETGFKAVR